MLEGDKAQASGGWSLDDLLDGAEPGVESLDERAGALEEAELESGGVEDGETIMVAGRPSQSG